MPARPSAPRWCGDPAPIRSTCQGRTVDATVLLASPSGKSLMLYFDALLDGHVGQMPILQRDDGSYEALLTGTPVTINPLPACP